LQQQRIRDNASQGCTHSKGLAWTDVRFSASRLAFCVCILGGTRTEHEPENFWQCSYNLLVDIRGVDERQSRTNTSPRFRAIRGLRSLALPARQLHIGIQTACHRRHVSFVTAIDSGKRNWMPSGPRRRLRIESRNRVRRISSVASGTREARLARSVA